jgi:hypothetical protein
MRERDSRPASAEREVPQARIDEWFDPKAPRMATCLGCFMPAPTVDASGKCIDCREPDRHLADHDHYYPTNRG